MGDHNAPRRVRPIVRAVAFTAGFLSVLLCCFGCMAAQIGTR